MRSSFLSSERRESSLFDACSKLTLLQLLMQLSQQPGNGIGDPGASIKVPDVARKLSLIKLALDNVDPSKKAVKEGFSLDSLRLNPEAEDVDMDEGDSDDEDLAPGLEGVDASEHMSVTAVNLLLALLEGELCR